MSLAGTASLFVSALVLAAAFWATREAELRAEQRTCAHGAAALAAQVSQLRMQDLAHRAQLKQLRQELARQVEARAEPAPVDGWTSTCRIERKANLSLSDFVRLHAQPRVPVILTDYAKILVPQANALSLERLERLCGHLAVQPMRRNATARAWGRLEYGAHTHLAEYLAYYKSERVRAPAERSATPWLLFDWSLATCPDLAQSLVMPRYFANDFLFRLPATGAAAADSTSPWPSLFLALAPSRTDLHVDAYGTHFWMAHVRGRKRWITFDKAATEWLNYTRADRVFELDAFSPLAPTSDALGRRVLRSDCVLQPGELVFMPEGTPHAVENIDDSLALAGNFIDETNLAAAIAELRIGDVDDEAWLAALESEALPRAMDMQIGDVPLPLLVWSEARAARLRAVMAKATPAEAATRD